jgi:hypothetical protein
MYTTPTPNLTLDCIALKIEWLFLALVIIMSQILLQKYLSEKKTIENKIEALKEVIALDKSMSIDSFTKARIRLDRSSSDSSSITAIWRAYRYWIEETGCSPKLSSANFFKIFENIFGKPKDNTYIGIFVFNTQEDVENYDKDMQISHP